MVKSGLPITDITFKKTSNYLLNCKKSDISLQSSDNKSARILQVMFLSHLSQ